MPTDRRGLQTRIRQALARTVLCLRVAKAVDALALLSASVRSTSVNLSFRSFTILLSFLTVTSWA